MPQRRCAEAQTGAAVAPGNDNALEPDRPTIKDGCSRFPGEPSARCRKKTLICDYAGPLYYETLELLYAPYCPWLLTILSIMIVCSLSCNISQLKHPMKMTSTTNGVKLEV